MCVKLISFKIVFALQSALSTVLTCDTSTVIYLYINMYHQLSVECISTDSLYSDTLRKTSAADNDRSCFVSDFFFVRGVEVKIQTLLKLNIVYTLSTFPVHAAY